MTSYFSVPVVVEGAATAVAAWRVSTGHCDLITEAATRTTPVHSGFGRAPEWLCFSMESSLRTYL